jgi:hypothetical protein
MYNYHSKKSHEKAHMNTTFSLVYFECTKNPTNILEVTNGPYLFESEKAAEERLLEYIRNRIAEAFLDSFLEELTELEVVGIEFDVSEELDSESAYSLMKKNADIFSFEFLVNRFNEWANDDDMFFGYKIEEVPTSSFSEEIMNADAVFINEQLFDSLSLASQDDNEFDMLFSVSGVTKELCRVEYDISMSDAYDATYESKERVWLVGNLKIRPVSLSD